LEFIVESAHKTLLSLANDPIQQRSQLTGRPSREYARFSVGINITLPHPYRGGTAPVKQTLMASGGFDTSIFPY
jgi:hypothetical protein